MNPKSFLFIGLWIQPIKALPLQQRWNVMEAVTAHEDTYVNACNAMHPVTAHEDTDANTCNAMHPDAPYDIISESVSRSVSVPISEKKSTSSSGACACERRPELHLCRTTCCHPCLFYRNYVTLQFNIITAI